MSATVTMKPRKLKEPPQKKPVSNPEATKSPVDKFRDDLDQREAAVRAWLDELPDEAREDLLAVERRILDRVQALKPPLPADLLREAEQIVARNRQAVAGTGPIVPQGTDRGDRSDLAVEGLGKLLAEKGRMDRTDAAEARGYVELGNLYGLTLDRAEELVAKYSAPPAAPRETPAAAGETKWDYGGTTLSRVPLGKIDRHPDNRVPTAEAIAKLAESIEREGRLLEPLVVRPIGGGRYQLLSGETRVLALAKLGRGKGEVDAHVVQCDDARALELLATYNAERTDLTPIDKARLIERLGASGKTRAEAARLVGLESHGAASNLVRLLELPPIWQERVARGELPWTFARELVPYAQSKRLMAAINADYEKAAKSKDEWHRRQWESRGAIEEHAGNVVGRIVRPVDQGEHHYGYEHFKGPDAYKFSGCYARLFELTPQIEADLELVELPGPEGKPARFATNVKRYEALQIPLIKAKVTAKLKKSVGATRDEKPAKAKKPPTAAELKAKAAEQAKVLAQRIERWRHRLLRRLVAERMDDVGAVSGLATPLKFLLWLAADPGWHHSDRGQVKLQEQIVRAVTGSEKIIRGGQAVNGYYEGGRARDVYTTVAAKWEELPAPVECVEAIGDLAAAVLRCESYDERRVLVPLAIVEDLARDLSIDLAVGWVNLQEEEPRDEEGGELGTFFEMHTAGQLDLLGDELGVFLGGAKTKADKVKLLLSISEQRRLPLPRALRPVAPPAAKRGTGGGGSGEKSKAAKPRKGR